MNFLLVGPPPDNSTDGVIIRGIKYLLNKNYPNANLFYEELLDHESQNGADFIFNHSIDLIVVCGTPWLWDSFHNSHKYKNLMECFRMHPNSKRLFMGIGSCLPLNAPKEILERPEEVESIRNLFGGATVISRDSIAHDKLNNSGISNALLMCPAYYCYGYAVPKNDRVIEHLLIWQDPQKSISAAQWADKEKLNTRNQQILQYFRESNPIVAVANVVDIPSAEALGLGTPILISNSKETLELVSRSKTVKSCRVHCAVPAIASGCLSVELYPLDSRHLVVEEFKNAHTEYSMLTYDSILKNLFHTRKLAAEASRTYEDKKANGFFNKYMSGKGLDIGYRGYGDTDVDPILETAIGIDMDYPGYDGKTLPFSDESQDYVYSSHCLEHIKDRDIAINEWFRVLKTNGHMVIIVPHQYLYEKKQAKPSLWNLDHKQFYTPGSLLSLIEICLTPNTYRVRFLEDGDKGFNYNISNLEHSQGQYEITLVIQKLPPPGFQLL